MVYGFTDSTEQLVETSQNFVVLIVAMLPFLWYWVLLYWEAYSLERSLRRGKQNKIEIGVNKVYNSSPNR